MEPQAKTQTQMNRESHSKRRLLSWIFIVALLSVIFWQRVNIVDWWLLRNYDPPVPVAALATETTMTERARKLFYINRPQIQEKAAFYTSCDDGETAIVLGCYKPPNGIYILEVDDARLAGVEQVTAAHELLHAVYDRLSDSERERVSNLVTDAYKSIQATNPAIAERLKLYEATGADTKNELHSILGTEVANLPPALEEHYAQYFSDRVKVVAYSDQYQAVFTARKQRVAELDKQLASIESQVAANNTELNSQEEAINAENARLNGLLQQQRIDEYNQGVAAYNQSLIPFRALLNQTRSLVEQYKTLLAERNSVAQEAQQLTKALSSQIQTEAEDK